MTRVIPLGNIVVAIEAAPASHDCGAGITVPAPPSQAGSITLWAIATRLGDAPVASEVLARATISSAETRHFAQCRSNPAENRLCKRTHALCVTTAPSADSTTAPVMALFILRLLVAPAHADALVRRG